MARLIGIMTRQPVDFTISVGNAEHVTLATHGWGAAWYEKKKLHVKKGVRSAVNPLQNQTVNLTVQSNQFLFHMRQASSGIISETNTHPFTYENSAFAHIGKVNKDGLLQLLTSPFNEKFESEPIDSEIYFRLIMQEAKNNSFVDAVSKAVSRANKLTGANFVLLNGESLYSYRFGLPMFWSRWNFTSPFAYTTQLGVQIKSEGLASQQAYIVSSEKLHDGNWTALDDGELFVVEKNLQYNSYQLITT